MLSKQDHTRIASFDASARKGYGQAASRREFLRRAAMLALGTTMITTLDTGCGDSTAHQPSSPTTPLHFPKDFRWGAATSAFQIEGATHEDGRGLSIWDTFCQRPGAIAGGANADIATDHYHRYAQDLDLMQSLGMQGYRFSIAWPRIVPDGKGATNAKGIDFYSRLVDGLLQRGIQPMATLYHWDLPQSLQDVGGWETRDTAQRFADYASIVAHALGDRVTQWLTLNEPKTVVQVGYQYGTHAPGFRDARRAYRAMHHLLLGHGLATAAIRAAQPHAQVGAALNLSPIYPADTHAGTADAVRHQDGLENRLYLDPLFHGTYPADITSALGSDWPDASIIQSGDLQIIAAPQDFLGINYYNPQAVTAGPQVVPIYPTSAATWEYIFPQGLTDILQRVTKDYGPLPLYITENGAPFADDANSAGHVADPQRQRYIHDHLVAAHKAIAAGVPLRGYYCWSLLDNFEWAEGYGQRWGIVTVDFATQQRTPKASALWYRDVIRANSLT